MINIVQAAHYTAYMVDLLIVHTNNNETDNEKHYATERRFIGSLCQNIVYGLLFFKNKNIIGSQKGRLTVAVKQSAGLLLFETASPH